MKITQNIEAGEIKNFWLSYNGDWKFTMADGSEIEFSVSNDILRKVAKEINEKIEELDEEILEEAKAKIAEMEIAVEETEVSDD